LYTCIHDKCEFQGTQLEINHHLHDCLYTIRKCKECLEKYQQIDHLSHISKCIWHTQCKICEKYIPYRFEDTHLNNEHEMQKCYYCHDIISNEKLLLHILDECEKRPVKCTYCFDYYEIKNENTHLRQHLIQKRDYISYLCSRLKNVENDYKTLDEYLRGGTRTTDVLNAHITDL
jgi:hypothetical protein